MMAAASDVSRKSGDFSINGRSNMNSISHEDDEESFVILGSSPSPSMLVDISMTKSDNDSLSSKLNSTMEKSTASQCTQSDSMKYLNMSFPMMLNSVAPAVPNGINGNETILIKDMSLDEIQRQFNILIEENTQMKENLLQNNNDLRREFNKIMKYQEEVRKTHEEHREKFDETRRLVNKLKTENALLKENLKSSSSTDESVWKNENDELKKKVRDLISSLESLKSEYESKQKSQTTSLTSLENENEILKLKLKQTEDKLQMIDKEKVDLQRELERTNLEVKIVTERKDEMTAKMNDLTKQVTNLTSAQHNSETMIVDLNAELKLCREQLQKAHLKLAHDKQDFEMISNVRNSESPNSSLFSVPSSSADTTDRLRTEVLHLQEKLKEANINRVTLVMDPIKISQSLDFSYSESSSTDINEKVRSYEQHMKDLVDWYNKHCKRINELQFSLGLIDQDNITSVQDLMPNFKQLKALGKEMSEDLTKEWDSFRAAQTNFQMIFNEYHNVVKELASVVSANKITEMVGESEIEKELKMQIDEAHAQVLAKDELIRLRGEELFKLRVELDDAKNSASEVQFLKAQLDCYKSDFDQERESRNRLAGEKEQLATDLRLLQRRNEQLLLDLQNRQNPSAPPNVATSSTTPNTANTERTVFPCPLCQFAFYTLQALENHVERCLDIRESM